MASACRGAFAFLSTAVRTHGPSDSKNVSASRYVPLGRREPRVGLSATAGLTGRWECWGLGDGARHLFNGCAHDLVPPDAEPLEPFLPHFVLLWRVDWWEVGRCQVI